MSDTGLISIQLGLATAWMHEERDTHGRWTHGAGLPTAPRSEERRGYHGHYEGYDPLVPSMAPTDARKDLSLPGRPDGAGTPDDPIDVQGNMTRAVQLMAIGKHVRLNGPHEIGPLLDEVDRQATAMGYNRDREPTWDLGNISVKGTRLFNEQTLGIPRNQMPQLSGNAPPGTEAAILAGGANRFIILDPQFRAQLERDGVDVKNERVPAGNLRATQSQLTAATVAGITKAAEGGNKAVLKMLREPIWVTSDNYVLDGHHRWASDEALAFSGHGPKDIEVHRIGLPARLAVPYANAFAAQMGIGPTGLGNAKLVNTANLLYPHVIELKFNLPDLKFSELIGPQVLQFGFHFNPLERRNARGEWTRGGAVEQLHIGRTLKKAVGVTPAVHYVTSGPMVDEARPEADKTAKITPGLLGGKNEIYDGVIKVFPADDKPDVLAELDWNGDLHLQDGVVTAMAAGRAHPDEPLEYPDAFQVVLHEMIHGVVPPDSEADNNRAYNQSIAAADIEEGFTEYGATLHAPEFFRQMGLADRKTTVEKSGFVDFDAQGRPVKNYYTVHEMAADILEPSNIAEGNAWGHYPNQTKDAQDWCQEVAKQMGYADLRPGTPGHDKVVELSDEVNRQGAAGKIRVMASQLAFAMTQEHPKVRADNQSMLSLMAGIEQDIYQEWTTGHALDTVAREKQRVQQQVEQVEREMAERGQL